MDEDKKTKTVKLRVEIGRKMTLSERLQGQTALAIVGIGPMLIAGATDMGVVVQIATVAWGVVVTLALASTSASSVKHRTRTFDDAERAAEWVRRWPDDEGDAPKGTTPGRWTSSGALRKGVFFVSDPSAPGWTHEGTEMVWHRPQDAARDFAEWRDVTAKASDLAREMGDEKYALTPDMDGDVVFGRRIDGDKIA